MIKYFLPILILLTSCSSYINKLYSDLDKNKVQTDQRRRDHFDRFRNNNPNNTQGINTNNLASNSPTTSSTKYVSPGVRRQYLPEEQVRKRYKANDLNDNSANGSLWAGDGTNNLFTLDTDKKNGDIVLINVLGKLKREITMELKRRFPDPPPLPGAAPKKPGAAPAAAAAPKPANDAGAGDAQSEQKVYDRISSVVIEEINKDHLLLRGQKFLLYKNRKRLVEVQALVARRDITNSDTVDSANIIESRINILR